MAARPTPLKQNDAKRIFKAAIQAGFETAKIVVYPDGRIEASAAFAEAGGTKPDSTNSWDEVLK